MLTYNQCKEFRNIDSPTGRVYDVPGGPYPSVTTVLGATKNAPWLDKWRAKVGEEEAKRILEAASTRGTLVHQYLENLYTENNAPSWNDARNFIASSNLNNEPSHIIKMTKELMKHLLANNYKSLAQEFVVWDDDLKIAGRCDSLGYWNGKLTLVDFKTATKPKTTQLIRDYYLQATAYCKAHNRLFTEQIDRFVILIANEQGTSQIFSGKPANYIPSLRYRVRQYYSNE